MENKFKNIEWVFFDMGYTLVNETPVHMRRIKYAAEQLKQKGINASADEMWQEVLTLGETNRSPVVTVLKSHGVDKVLHYTPDGEEVYPDAADALKKLHEKYKIGIIANQPVGCSERLEAFGLLEHIDVVFGSEECGLFKPDVELYKFALEKTGCLPERALMVGDRSDNDIVPATNVGMRTARILRGYFSTAKDIIDSDVTITYLNELVTLLC